MCGRNSRLPVLAVEADHEFLKVVNFVHVGGFILNSKIKTCVTLQAEVLVNEFIKSLLFKYQIAHLSRKRVGLMIVFADVLLDVHEKLDGQVT